PARAHVLPCGVDLERFQPLPRAQAREELGLDQTKPYLLFPADPSRPEKRYELARELATPVGIHEDALAGIAGTLCAPFELARWRAALAPHLFDRDPRVAGRS